MSILLLAVIYLVFISLGLPDGVFGFVMLAAVAILFCSYSRHLKIPAASRQ